MNGPSAIRGVLRLKNEGGEGTTFALREGHAYVIGRGKRSDFRLLGIHHVSRCHCLVRMEEGMCRVTDLYSSNGTFVNGKGVKHAVLRSGDQVAIGLGVLEYRVGSGLYEALLPSWDTEGTPPVGMETGAPQEAPDATDQEQELPVPETPATGSLPRLPADEPSPAGVLPGPVPESVDYGLADDSVDAAAPPEVDEVAADQPPQTDGAVHFDEPTPDPEAPPYPTFGETGDPDSPQIGEPEDEPGAELVASAETALAEEEADTEEIPDSADESSVDLVPSLVEAKCEKCGALEDVEWTPGSQCPNCASPDFFPVVQVEVEGADTYYAADRTSGSTIYDRRFAMMAHWSGALSRVQMEDCLRAQDEAARRRRKVLPVHRIMLEKEYAEQGQVTALLEVLRYYSIERNKTKADNLDFLETAKSMGLISLKQSEGWRNILVAMGSEQGIVPAGLWAIETGRLTEKKVLRVYRSQAKRHRGLQHDLDSALKLVGYREPQPRGAPESYGKPLKGAASESFRKEHLVLVALALLALAVWGKFALTNRRGAQSGGSQYPSIACAMCGEEWNHVPLMGDLRCERCSRRAARAVINCQGCGKQHDVPAKAPDTVEGKEPYLECPLCYYEHVTIILLEE